MCLQTSFHPLFKVNRTIQFRLLNFFKYKDQQVMKMINSSKNDLCLLYELRKLLYKPNPKPVYSKYSKERELSRTRDIKIELDIVRKQLNPSFSYLDLGCSEGKITTAVIENLELSPEQSFACDIFPQEPNPLFRFTQNFVSHLPFSDRQFTFITLFMSAHHFSHMDDMMKEIYRILVPGGYVLIREHNYKTPDDTIFYNIIHGIYSCVLVNESTPYDFLSSYIEIERKSYYAHYRSIKEWQTLFKEYGFNIVGKAHGFFDPKTYS